jgi:hypothetical protein
VESSNESVRRMTWDKQTGTFVAEQPGHYLKVWFDGWLCRAGSLPGKSLAVALCIQYRARTTGSLSDLTVSTELVARLGVNRYAKTVALRHLERAGLIAVQRNGHQAPRVWLPRLGQPSPPAAAEPITYKGKGRGSNPNSWRWKKGQSGNSRRRKTAGDGR